MTDPRTNGSVHAVARRDARFLSLVSLMRPLAFAACLLLAPALALAAQSAAEDARDARGMNGARLLTVLPADIAQRVMRLAADARAHALPGAAIESAALEMRAKGASPRLIERRVTVYARLLADARAAMTVPDDDAPSDAEITAAAAALSRGVGAVALHDFAARAPAGRPLALPLFVVSSLIDRGLTPRDALGRVGAELAAHASDEQLLALPDGLLGLPVPEIAGQGAAERWRSIGGPAGRSAPVPAMASPVTGAVRQP